MSVIREVARNFLFRFPEFRNGKRYMLHQTGDMRVERTYCLRTGAYPFTCINARVKYALCHSHWITDVCLPILAHGLQCHDYPISVPPGTTERHCEILRAFGINNRIYRAAEFCPPQSLLTPYVPLHKWGEYMHYLGIAAWNESKAAISDDTYPKRIFIGRGDSKRRKLLNECEVVKRLNDLGFLRIIPGGMPFDKQLKFFHNAEVIVGVHGAGLANLCVTRNGASVIEIMPRLGFTHAYSIISEARGLKYSFVMGEQVGLNLRLNPNLLVATVKHQCERNGMGVR